MMKNKTIIPNDFRDFLSIISIIGFLGIFLEFTFGVEWINNNASAFFLLLGGLAFLFIGKLFTIRRWVKDGIQQNEVSSLLALVFGSASIIISIMLFIGSEISTKLYGFVGFLALVPAFYIFIDYLAKNN